MAAWLHSFLLLPCGRIESVADVILKPTAYQHVEERYTIPRGVVQQVTYYTEPNQSRLRLVVVVVVLLMVVVVKAGGVGGRGWWCWWW